MKKWSIFIACALCAAILAACGGAVSSSQSSEAAPANTTAATSGTEGSEPVETLTYRGEVTSLEDGSLVVQQPEGQNYGQPSILFHISEETGQEEGGIALAVGAFVEVTYNGLLTRSVPPQGTAQSIKVLSASAEGAVVNGTIRSVEDVEGGYTIGVLPFAAEVPEGESDYTYQIILMVPAEALEGLTAADLVEGNEVSAVTKGIATMSLPPQMPVHALLPYVADRA